MSLLSEIKAAVTGCGLPVETGVFSGEPPEEYVVVTPLADTYELHADNLPGYEAQEARLSLFSKGNYLMRKGQLSNALLAADFVITDRRYIGHEDDTGYHHYAIDVAKEAGCLISFDPNLRPPLWNTLEDARKEIEYGLSKADILKISDNEVEFLCGTSDYDEGAKMLIEKYNIPFVCVTLGKDGSRAYYKGMRVEVPGFVQKNTIETTGAGDTFCGCMLHYIIQHGLEDLTEENLRELLTFANAAASVITTRKGALAVMPSKEEVERLLRG